jgi:hypothetical protein
MEVLIELNAPCPASAFCGKSSPSRVNQNPPHQLSAYRKEVCPIARSDLASLRQLQESLIDQGGRPQGLPGAQPPPRPVRSLPEFRI